MKVLIVEDEQLAADRLNRLLSDIDKNIEVIGHLDSIKSTLEWFRNNEAPELMFLDIQLADGLSFEIFEEQKISCPIIFTTAYSEYALRAFKLNSIDYLLKPIAPDELMHALEKFSSQSPKVDVSQLLNMLQDTSSYKERFVIKVGEHLKSVLTSEIEIFYSLEKATYLQKSNAQKFVIDFTLDQVEGMVDPRLFFRVNRKQIVHIDAIEDIISYSSSRLKLKLKQYHEEEIIVARDRVNQFKNWLDR